MESYLDVATLTGKKNLDGRLVAKTAPGLPFLLQEGMRVWLVPPVIDSPRQVTVDSVVPGEGESAVVAFAEVSSVQVAEALVGCHCLARASECALGEDAGSLGAAVSAALAGWRFVDEVSGRAGVVSAIEERGGQTLLVVVLDDEPGREHLVPYAEGLVVDEDAPGRRIVAACPCGLFDL